MKIKPTFLIIIITLCLIFIWNAYRKIDFKSKIYSATYTSVEDVISGEALAIKDEHLIKTDTAGFFQNTVANNSRVFASQSVGCLYIGDFDPQLVHSLNLVNEKLREAELSQNSQETLINDATTVDNTIAQYTIQMSSLGAEADQQQINRIRREIDTLLQRKKSITEGKNGNAGSVVSTLGAQKQELEAKLGSTKKNLYAPTPGLFVMGADGLEETLTLRGLGDLTLTRVQELLQQGAHVPDKSIYPYPVAKVTDNNKWVLAVVCDSDKAQQLSGRDTVEIRLKTEGLDTLTCSIKSISPPQDGKCLLLISGTKEIYNIYNSRKIDVDVLVSNYEGLKIPAKAVLNDDKGTYVNVSDNGIISKKYVNILYTDGDYSIAEENNAQDGALRLYDEVVS